MKNIIEYALIQSDGSAIGPEHIPMIHTASPSPTTETLSDKKANTLEDPLALEPAESALIEFALEQSEDNIAAAARMLGTSRPKIYRYLMKKGRAI